MNKRQPEPDRPPPTPVPSGGVPRYRVGFVERCFPAFMVCTLVALFILGVWAVLKRYGFTE